MARLLAAGHRLSDLQAKMQEWIANGAELAWLIDPERQSPGPGSEDAVADEPPMIRMTDVHDSVE